MLPNRRSAFEDAPFADLLAILLRQLKRPLADRGVTLTDPQVEALAQAIAAHADTGAQGEAIRAALVALVAESEAVLAQWNLTFEQSLDAQMNDIPGWESTAEFLDLANRESQCRTAHLDWRGAAGSARRSTLRAAASPAGRAERRSRRHHRAPRAGVRKLIRAVVKTKQMCYS